MTPDLRDLDRAIAEARGLNWSENFPDEILDRLEYSTDPAWTLRLLEEMREAGASLNLFPADRGWRLNAWLRGTEGNFTSRYAPTLPEAVARAWLAWHEATKSPAG